MWLGIQRKVLNGYTLAIARHIKDSFVGLLIESIVWFNCRLEKKE